MNKNYHKLKNLLTTVNVEKIPMTIRQQIFMEIKFEPEMEANSQIHYCNSEQ